jgi:hypothetical protein
MTLPRRLVLAGLTGLALPARAHGFHAAFTVIEANPRTQALEIIHRLFTQDLEVLIKARTNARVALEDGPAFERALSEYLNEVFTLTTGGKPLTPAWIGAKVAVDSVMAYQEIPGAATVKELTVRCRILTETHPGQINTVNVTIREETQTLTFMAGDAAQQLRF